MPELPEVEYARRRLDEWARGRTIEKATAAQSRLLRPMSASSFVQKLKGRTVRLVERRGKWLRLTLDDGQKLFSHLGMSGKWIEAAAKVEAVRAEKLRLVLSGKRGKPETVRLLDPRMFGRLILSTDDIPQWTELGPDPYAAPLDAKALGDALAGSKRTIKEKLLDQTLIAGVGNIYATEALWRAKIDPRSQAGAIPPGELRKLVRAIKWTMDQSIARQGDEAMVYVEEAKAPNPFRIYGHGGEACPRCKEHRLAKIVLGGRGTVFCPNCQVRYGAATATAVKRTAATRARTKAPRRTRRAAIPKS